MRRHRSRSEAAEPAGRPKIADRIGPAAGSPEAANAPAAAVAQKVVLYDEDPSNPKGTRYVGSATLAHRDRVAGTGAGA